MSLFNWYRKLSTSKKIYLSTFIGLLLGVFFGDLCDVLEPINALFIGLFQTAIIPYILFSIIQAIGSLTPDRAKIIGKKGGITLVALWLISVIFVWGLQFSLPDIERSKFFQPLENAESNYLHLINLFIPANPFNSLSNGYVPAIVVFSMLVGIAIINEKRKSSLIDYASILASLMRKINGYVMILLPLGILIISTYTFGTQNFTKYKSILLYIFASIFYLVFISMVVYPGVLSCISKISYKQFLNYTMAPALIAFATGNIFLALPMIYDLMYKFDETNRESEVQTSTGIHERNYIDIIVPLAWIVPASYKFLVIFFVIFEYWYYDKALNSFEQLLYYIAFIPCLFGSNSVIVPLILQIAELSKNDFNFFMLASNFVVYFNNANGAIFIVVVTIICYLSIKGKTTIRWGKMILVILASFLVFIAALLGLKSVMKNVIAGNKQIQEELSHMNIAPYNTEYYDKIDETYSTIDKYHHIELLYPGEPLLDKIVRTGIMQVGYAPNLIPFSFFNFKGELVGYDIDYVYDIAEMLHCNKIEFYPIHNSKEFKDCIDKGIDLSMGTGGYLYHADVSGSVMTSDPYMEYTIALVIPSKDKNKFKSFDSILRNNELTIGERITCFKVFSLPFNKERFKYLNNIEEDFYINHKTYALLTSAEFASAMGIKYPEYSIFPYKGDDIFLYTSFLLPYGSKTESFRQVVNTWIQTSFKFGLNKDRYNYWIKGGTARKDSNSNWSILNWIMNNSFFTNSEEGQN